MQTRWPGGSIATLYGPPIAPVSEPLHNSLHKARPIKAEFAAVAECDQLVRKKCAVLLDCLSNRHRIRVDAVLALRIHIRLRVRSLRIREFRDNILSPDDVRLSRLSL